MKGTNKQNLVMLLQRVQITKILVMLLQRVQITKSLVALLQS